MDETFQTIAVSNSHLPCYKALDFGCYSLVFGNHQHIEKQGTRLKHEIVW